MRAGHVGGQLVGHMTSVRPFARAVSVAEMERAQAGALLATVESVLAQYQLMVITRGFALAPKARA